MNVKVLAVETKNETFTIKAGIIGRVWPLVITIIINRTFNYANFISWYIREIFDVGIRAGLYRTTHYISAEYLK